MDMLYLSPTEWWELAPGQDLEGLRGQLAALTPGQVQRISVLVTVQGSQTSNVAETLLVFGSQLRTSLITTFEVAPGDAIMPHHAPLPGPSQARVQGSPSGDAILPH